MSKPRSEAPAERSAVEATIRPAERRDVNRIVELWSALMANGHRADPRWAASPAAAGILVKWASASWLVREPFPVVWVAEIDGLVVGFVEGSTSMTSPLVQAPPTATIASAWVEATHRGQGLGRALVDAFVSAARVAGIESIEVGTLALDGPANSFWRAMGFSDWRVVLRR